MIFETDEEKAINNDFITIMKRGVQWAYAEDNNVEIPLDDIDIIDDWVSYGRYQDEAAKIFNNRYPDWHVTATSYNDDNDELVFDYFDEAASEYDEYTISIERKKTGDKEQ